MQDFFHPQYVTWGDRFWSIPSSIPFQSHFNILGAQTVNHPYHELSQLVGLPSDLGYQSKVCAPATRRSGWWRFISVCCFCGRQKPQADHHINSQRPNGYSATIIRKRKKKRLASQFHPGPIHSKTSSKKDVNWCKKKHYHYHIVWISDNPMPIKSPFVSQ